MARNLIGMVGALGVTGAVLLASAGAAEAASWQHVAATANSNGTWTLGQTVRVKSGTGSIVMKLGDNVDGGLCVRLVSVKTGSVFTGTVCWDAAAKLPSTRTIATQVLTNTQFQIQHRKQHGSRHNSGWGADLYY